MIQSGLSTSHVFKYGEYDFPGQQQQSALQRRRIKPKFTGSLARGGGGGGVHLIVQQTTLNISDFLVRKSSRRQIANFVNYPGDWRHESGDQKMRLKIWRLPGYPGELTAPEASHTCNFLQKN